MNVAHNKLDVEACVQNVMCAVRKLSEGLPGGADNIRNMHLRTVDSPALPIYMSHSEFTLSLILLVISASTFDGLR